MTTTPAKLPAAQTRARLAELTTAISKLTEHWRADASEIRAALAKTGTTDSTAEGPTLLRTFASAREHCACQLEYEITRAQRP
ncbi:hypothetical protein KO481_16955 [Nocardia sp. NEAU-G5]|uniref:Uncharacterized protein n=1 Tax=Nocardia albiluteola TaxID=2842303 RepID=A0ABS6B0E4_9NOCA|nr:hypothetical protein [Nocardia albiluteola]MBU3063211.1 hypothetical protein [Nocardia albiluteola]